MEEESVRKSPSPEGDLVAQLVRIADFVDDLTRELEKSGSLGDLFRTTFRLLHDLMPFDVAASLMLEQTLDLYISRREGADRIVSERLVGELRSLVQSEIPVSLGAADVVTQGDFADLPRTLEPGDPLAVKVNIPLMLDERAAGLLVLFRSEDAFDPKEVTLLRIVSSHVIFAIANLRTRDQLRDLAETDELTGIWNRRYMRRRLTAEVERAKTYNLPLSVMMIDVDNLKAVNDRYGHGMGDVLISELCGAIRETLRTPDALARWGGDEFLLVTPHTDSAGARQLAGRLLEIVRETEIPTGDGQRIRPTVSIGVASYFPPDMTATEVVQRADDRLLDAKRAGRNRFTW